MKTGLSGPILGIGGKNKAPLLRGFTIHESVF